jgi:hypothetical protein
MLAVCKQEREREKVAEGPEVAEVVEAVEDAVEAVTSTLEATHQISGLRYLLRIKRGFVKAVRNQLKNNRAQMPSTTFQASQLMTTWHPP